MHSEVKKLAITQSAESQDGHESISPVERIYYEWDRALSSNDANALAELYAEDATIESPLIPHLWLRRSSAQRV